MNEHEALEAFFAEWHRQANEYGASLTREQRDCAEEAWHAALAWLRSQGEPVGRFNWETGEFEFLVPWDYETHNMKPLYLAPRPAIPAGWLDRGKAALAECRAADDLWSDDRLLSRLFNAMTAATQPVAPGGWKLVPMEPTPTMLSAGAEGSGEFIEHAHFVWTQMLAAAPEPSK